MILGASSVILAEKVWKYPTMNALSLALALLSVGTAQKLTLDVNCKNGEVLTGSREFRVTANAGNDPVTQVEYYVGADLVDSDTSTPYVFQFDALEHEEGPIQVRFKAYTSDGKTGEVSLKLTVDNGLSKGIAFHLEQGNSLLTEQKFKEAFTSGRIAQKIDPKSAAAKVVLSRASIGLGNFDSAQKFAEDAAEIEPTNLTVQDLIAGINIRRSFRLVNRAGTDRKETLSQIQSALVTAVKARRKVLDAAVDGGAPTAETTLAYADAAMRAGRYSLAIQYLDPLFESDNTKNGVANRLGYALLRADRSTDALKTMVTHERYGKPDAYGFALLAILNRKAGNEAASDENLKAASLADDQSLGLRTAQAYLALVKNQNAVLQPILRELAADEGQRSEVLYYVSALNARLGRFQESRKAFEQAISAEPTNVELYLEQAGQALAIAQAPGKSASDKEFLYDTAKVYFEVALAARPESSDALAGLSLIALYQNDLKRALAYAEAAAKAVPNDALGHYALATAAAKQASALSKLAGGASSPEVFKYQALAQDENKLAGKLDDRYVGGRSIPREVDLYKYLSDGARNVVLVPPK
jgi:thioredoxin-like negative regulator of GroEL